MPFFGYISVLGSILLLPFKVQVLQLQVFTLTNWYMRSHDVTCARCCWLTMHLCCVVLLSHDMAIIA